ncbi:MAG: N-acetylmuramyl-L-alanine amidase, negative regulator of AmpC, AmpD [Bacteroidetes bacterium]|nr:N-acetylmuramyl-L-alanine amidase, negative regulator of AmpC, AmpD [Bacteroidota bacterium]
MLKINSTGKIIAAKRLNIRSDAKRVEPPIAVVEAGTELTYYGYTEEGEPIDGNSKWYFTKKGTWFWSGGVAQPVKETNK